MSQPLPCDYCTSGAAFLVTFEVPDGPRTVACKTHLAVAVTKLAERAGTVSAAVYVLDPKTGAITGGLPGVDQVQERARRIGAHSRDDAVAARMEYELYLAVLVLVAQGAPSPAALAAAALVTQNYHFERLTS